MKKWIHRLLKGRESTPSEASYPGKESDEVENKKKDARSDEDAKDRSTPKARHAKFAIRHASRFTYRACCHGAKGCHHSLNVVISVLLCLQIIVAAMAIMGLEIPVPGPLQRHLSSKLEKEGIKLQMESLSFDLTGGVHAVNLKLSDMGNQPILEAHQVYFDFPIFAGGWDISHTGWVQIENLSLICPARLSPSGADKVIANKGFISARLSPEGLNIRHAQAVIGGTLPVHAKGIFNLPIEDSDAYSQKEAAPGKPTEEEKTYWQEILPAISKATSELAALEHIKGAHLTLRGLSGHKILARILAKEVNFQEFTAKDLYARTIAYPEDRSGMIQLNASYLEAFKTMLTDLQGDAFVKIPRDIKDWKRSTLMGRAYARSVQGSAERIDSVYLHGHNNSRGAKASARVSFENLPAHVSFEKSGNAAPIISVEMQTVLGPWLRLAGVPEEEVNKRLKVSRPLYVRATAKLKEDNDFEANFDLTGWDMDVRGTPIGFLNAKGRATKTELFCKDLLLLSGPNSAKGSYWQSLQTPDWRLRLIGSVYPPVIGGILGTWWDEIWTDFEFPGPTVVADLDIQGNWNKRGHADIWGNVELNDIVYSGVHIDHGDLILNVGEGFVNLYDIEARSGKSSMGGKLAWILEPDKPMLVTLDMNSTLPLEEVNLLFGSAFTSQLPDWTLPEAPNMHLMANLAYLNDGSWTNDVFIQAQVYNGAWKSIPFNQLLANVIYRDGDALIHIPHAEMMNGSMEANIDIDTSGKDASNLALALAMKNVDMQDALGALVSLGGKEEQDDEASKENQDEASDGDNKKPGKLDLNFSGNAKLNDVIGTLKGSGDFIVTEAELGKIKAFWLLSSLLDGMGLGIGSFTLDTIEANFAIEDSVCSFPKAEIGGPAIRVETKGDINIATNGLNFDAKVFLLQSPRTSIINIIGAILSPVGYILELRLKGTIDDPSWRFKIDPRNLFDSDETEEGEAAPSGQNTRKSGK